MKGNEPDFYLTQPKEQKRSCFMKEQSFNSQLIKKKKIKNEMKVCLKRGTCQTESALVHNPFD